MEWSDGRLARPAGAGRGRPALHYQDRFVSYFSTRENSPVEAFTATRSLAVSRSVP